MAETAETAATAEGPGTADATVTTPAATNGRAGGLALRIVRVVLGALLASMLLVMALIMGFGVWLNHELGEKTADERPLMTAAECRDRFERALTGTVNGITPAVRYRDSGYLVLPGAHYMDGTRSPLTSVSRSLRLTTTVAAGRHPALAAAITDYWARNGYRDIQSQEFGHRPSAGYRTEHTATSPEGVRLTVRVEDSGSATLSQTTEVEITAEQDGVEHAADSVYGNRGNRGSGPATPVDDPYWSH
ncbi:hypothetical protein [Streptomyces sp. CB01881]|uniref:hypothetical protein n=1 Tax=Streptomyces sp. CB01881 TaxID=2078691 RepID=UPI0011E00C4C|nr:hypothetical protein [Streptomyces sp. CB01881]TYC70267.1 hypothetical protein EH183_30715 [Streptomyces sp. CB01881]